MNENGRLKILVMGVTFEGVEGDLGNRFEGVLQKWEKCEKFDDTCYSI